MQKPNIWLGFIWLLGFDFKRFEFDKYNSHYIISARGSVSIIEENGEKFKTSIKYLSDETKLEILNEKEKMY
jgi:hypothetical protein